MIHGTTNKKLDRKYSNIYRKKILVVQEGRYNYTSVGITDAKPVSSP